MLETIIIVAIIFLVSAIPLNIAARLLGGQTHLLQTAVINIIAGVIVALVHWYVPVFGGIIAFVALLFIYRMFFKVGWIKAFLIWILQLILTAALITVAAMIGFAIILF